MKLASIIVRQDDTHRLVARQYVLDEQGPLSRLADDEAELSGLTELERSTDNRVLGESGLLLGISIHELVFGVPYAHNRECGIYVCASHRKQFKWPGGRRLVCRLSARNLAQVAYHRAKELQEINWPHPEVFEHLEYLADFRGGFHDIRKQPDFHDCLSPDSYAASQRLAQMLPQEGSAGIIYPSVKEKKHANCTVAFGLHQLRMFVAGLR